VRRLFTPKQANRALPLIRSIVEDITSAGHRLHQIAIGASPELDPVGIHELESETANWAANTEPGACSKERLISPLKSNIKMFS